MLDVATIHDLYAEPACAKSTSEKRTACEKPEPGSTATGCAFQGARFSLLPFEDCVHIIHAPSTCASAALPLRTYNMQNPYKWVFTTDMGLNDLIFGGEKKLCDAIDDVFERYTPKGIFLYATCVSALIGEDFEAVAREKEQLYKIPILIIGASGFVGNNQFGAKVAALSLLERVIGTRKPDFSTPYDVNLWGEYDTLGDMSEYTQLLEKLGIRVLTTFSAGSTLESIACAHRAKLNILVSANSLITVARKMKERWRIPWVNVTFNGKRDTSDALRAITQELKDPLLARKAQELIIDEEQKLESTLAPYREKLRGKKALLNAAGDTCWRYIPLLIDSGINLIATSVDKGDDPDTEKAESYLLYSALFMRDPDAMQEHIIEHYAIDIFLGERQNRYVSTRHKIVFFDLGRADKTSFIGYQGSVNFIKELARLFDTPMFTILNKEIKWIH